MIGSRSYKAYSVPLPQLPVNPYNFYFTVNAPDGTYTFFFVYMGINVEGISESNWYFYCVTPSNQTRWGSIKPNAMQWSQSSDVGVVFTTSLSAIGQNDLTNIQMYMCYWNVP